MLEVIATPGHSAGSMSYLLTREGALFTGDAVPLAGDMPIYDDFCTSIATLEQLQRMKEPELLLEAWQAPRTQGIGGRIAEGVSWLQRVDAAVQQSLYAESDPMSLCRRVVTHLELPPSAANPLVARSLRSHPLVDY